MMNLVRVVVVFCLTSVVLWTAFGCDRQAGAPVSAKSSEPQLLPQGLQSLPMHRRPYANVNLAAASRYNPPLDEDSIEMFEYRGGIHYHPVGLCNRCYLFLAAFAHTGDSTFLNRTERSVRKLMAVARIKNGAAWIPYTFDFAVHSDSANLFRAPWYSGMAQGEFLSIVSRLYEVTNDEDYLDFGRQLFRSLLYLRTDDDPMWVVRLDDDRFYWIEEYPHHQRPGMTLNGYIAGLFGVYDYYLVTNDPEARRVWDMAITTLKYYLPRFLKEKNSFYCLGHNHPATDGYHQFHISLLDHLHRMTDDPYFRIMKDAYTATAATNDST